MRGWLIRCMGCCGERMN